MDRARASAIGVIATAVLASGLLWLVPGVTRQVEGRGEEAPRRDITSEEANAQVKAAMDALEAGINQGNPDLALVAYATGDAEWLAQQRVLVTGIIERLQGHPAKLHYSHPSYWVHMAGGKEVVARRVYAGPTLVVDTVTGHVAGEIQRYAIAPEGRFQLHPFPARDARLRTGYGSSLGGLYAALGDTVKALEIWRGVIEDDPDDGSHGIASVHAQMARVLAETGDLAAAYAAYARALERVGDSHSFGGMDLEGTHVQVRTQDQLQLRLAETAQKMGDEAKARGWYEGLLKSETEELANLAAERLKAL